MMCAACGGSGRQRTAGRRLGHCQPCNGSGQVRARVGSSEQASTGQYRYAPPDYEYGGNVTPDLELDDPEQEP